MYTKRKSMLVRIASEALLFLLFCCPAFAQQYESPVRNMLPDPGRMNAAVSPVNGPHRHLDPCRGYCDDKHRPFEADRPIDKIKYYSLEMIPANRAIWSQAQSDMKQDLEMFANQLNLYLSTPGVQEAAAGRDQQLLQEIVSFRQQLDKLIYDSTMSRSRAYWQGRLIALRGGIQRVNGYVNSLAPDHAVVQHWLAIQSDFDRMNPCVY